MKLEQWQRDDLKAVGLGVILAAILLAARAYPADLGTGSPPRLTIAAVAKPVVKQSLTTPAGWHTHVCPRCGTSWSHGHDAFGSVAQHTCPRCGAVQWHKSPVTQLKVPCPPGVH